MTTENDKRSKLPKGWAWSTLGEICLSPQYGWTTSAADHGHLRLLRTTDITSGAIDWTSVPYCKVEPVEKDKYLLSAGDIVISRAGSVGFSLLIEREEPAVFASYLIRFKPLIDERYLAYFLKSPAYWQAISVSSVGIAVPNVNATKLKLIALLVAPLPEQRRIVEKIEELFTQLDAGIEELRKAQEQLKRYRQAVLNAAVTGELTREWREAHKDELEPASELLARILKERRDKWEAEQFAKMRATGKKPSTNEWKNKYREPPSPADHNLPALPSGWIWSAFGQAFRIYVGATPSRPRSSYWNGDLPWVSSSEVAFCRIKSTRETITELGLQNTSTDLHPAGTVLLGMIGEGKTRGQAAILDISACNSQNSAAIRVSEAGISSEYIYYYLQSEYESTRKLGSGNNQPALNKSRVQGMNFPLPPLAEQNAIVQEVDRLLSVADTIQQSIERELIQADRLRHSILKQAFEGELVPQDPNDEPAERLLERIKLERAKREAEKQAEAKSNRKRSPKKRPQRTERPAA